MDRYEYKMQRLQYKMARRRHRSPASGIVFGSFIVIIGLLFLLDNMHIIRLRDVWQFWPLLLVVFGLSRIFECHTPSSFIWGGLVTLIGALLFLDNLNILVVDFNLIWPLILIALGGMLLWRAVERKRYADGVDGGDGVPVITQNSRSLFAVFGGGHRRITSENFKGCDVLAIFGGYEIDLRDAKMEGEKAVVDVNATFGGVEIFVPPTWQVVPKVSAVFGGIDDKTVPPRADQNVKPPLLVITGVTVFGGVSIRN